MRRIGTRQLFRNPAEEIIQFSLSLREGFRKQHARLADDADMTVRAFVPDELKAKGLDVRPGDLMDLRNERRCAVASRSIVR